MPAQGNVRLEGVILWGGAPGMGWMQVRLLKNVPRNALRHREFLPYDGLSGILKLTTGF